MNQLSKYSSFIPFILFALITIVQSQECTAGDCIEGYGHYIYKDGSKYMGMFEDGKKSGEGEYVYSDGSTYIGNFIDGTFILLRNKIVTVWSAIEQKIKCLF